MRLLIVFLVCIQCIYGQITDNTAVQNHLTEKFTYSMDGLDPRHVIIRADSLDASKILNKLVSFYEKADQLFKDESYRITKDQVSNSFILKGKRMFVFCGKNFIGQFCLHAKYEISFQCNDGFLILEPLFLKRSTNSTNTTWSKVPFDRKANFYKKDGSLKQQCLNGPKASEDIFNRIVMLSTVALNETSIELLN